jgi:hypothetical protein
MSETISNTVDDGNHVGGEVKCGVNHDARQAEWYRKIDEHNERLSVLAREGRLTADDVFGRSRLLDDLKPWLADFFKKELGRDHRLPDGTIDFYKEFDDTCWDTADVIVDAMLQLVIGIYDRRYGGNCIGGVEWLQMKATVFGEYLKNGDYNLAPGCLTDGTC